MKVKLLRNTMIAGTPTSAGSIIDVEDHIGFMLLNIHKAVEADIKKEKFFRAASLEMLDSKWARQVKSRAKKMAIAMRSGEF